MKTSKYTRYFLYLLSITGVFSLSMLMITIILLGFNTFVFLLGVPAGIMIVLTLKPYIGEYIYGEEESVHKYVDTFDSVIEYGSLVIIMVSLRFFGEKGEMPSYLLGEALRLTWLFTKIFVGGALLLNGVRHIVDFFSKEKPTKTYEVNKENLIEEE